jgi:hypothetical protein
VAVELVEPHLAHDREVDPDEHTDAQAFSDRLTAHLSDFVAYRGELPRVRRLKMH